MIDQPLGASLDRDLTTAPGRRADKEIENFISRRDQQRRKEEGERQEEAWKESVRRYEAARDAHLRQEWCEYHTAQAVRHRTTLEALVAHHEAETEKYLPKFQSPDTRVGVRNNGSIQKGA
jgi:broad specificity phosphatase PhoE